MLKTASAGGSLGPERYLGMDSLRGNYTGSIDVATFQI